MIKNLHIKNYAIINELNIDFKSGLTVITGETGSGKSILLESLAVSLGAKVNKEMVKSKEKRAVINVSFSDRDISRIISNQGRSKSYQNDEPISLNELKKENNTLIDFHGQHDQQLILNNKSHIDYLDQYCQHQKDVDKLISIHNEIIELRNTLDSLKIESKDKNDRLSLLEFQANEIDLVNPSSNEEQVIQQKYSKLSNVKKIKEILQNSKYSLYDCDPSIEQQIIQIQKKLIGIIDYDTNVSKISELLKEVMIQLDEANSELVLQIEDLDFDNEEMIIIADRINAFDILKRKYGGTIESVLDYRKKIQSEILSLKTFDKSENILKSNIKTKEDAYSKIAIKIHKNRKVKSKELSMSIEKKMSDLNMPNSKFDIKIDLLENKDGFVKINNKFYKEHNKGIDNVQFFLSTNSGEPVKPLSFIASGGEISRIMLSIKTVFQDLDPVETLVFDEIDTGISGVAAKKVSNHLLELSKSKQVICITHLSQIVNQANNHLHVSKYSEGGNTFVNVKYLNKNERSKIIYSLFHGEQVAVT
ncbi:MAG: hypothetical protein CMG55_07235 [Candidatus Marinimicrobia bacterium]|nr:hypothetical protein [Candidatus Neomarinimicrobiota bacterium]